MSEDIEYGPTPTRDGATFKGVCKMCKRPIYHDGDHAEGCIYG